MTSYPMANYRVFSDENYVNEDLSRAQVFPYLSDCKFIDCDMRKIHMSGGGREEVSSVNRCDFRGCDLRDGMLVRCNISDSQFIECDMRLVYLHHGGVQNTVFMGTKHAGSSMSGTRLINCLFWGADLKRLRIEFYESVSFIDCRFVGCDLPMLHKDGMHLVKKRRKAVPSMTFFDCKFEEPGEVDWRPGEAMPEDYYTGNRRSRGRRRRG